MFPRRSCFQHSSYNICLSQAMENLKKAYELYLDSVAWNSGRFPSHICFIAYYRLRVYFFTYMSDSTSTQSRSQSSSISITLSLTSTSLTSHLITCITVKPTKPNISTNLKKADIEVIVAINILSIIFSIEVASVSKNVTTTRSKSSIPIHSEAVISLRVSRRKCHAYLQMGMRRLQTRRSHGPKERIWRILCVLFGGSWIFLGASEEESMLYVCRSILVLKLH